MNEVLLFAFAFWVSVGLLIGTLIAWLGSIIYKEFRNGRSKR